MRRAHGGLGRGYSAGGHRLTLVRPHYITQCIGRQHTHEHTHGPCESLSFEKIFFLRKRVIVGCGVLNSRSAASHICERGHLVGTFLPHPSH